MNLNVVNVVVFAVGAILLYAAIKDTDPRAVVKSALGTPLPASGAAPSASHTPASARPTHAVVSV